MPGRNWINLISWILGTYQKGNVFQRTSKSWKIDPWTWTFLRFKFICRKPACFDFNQLLFDYGYPSTMKALYSESTLNLWTSSMYVYIWKRLKHLDFFRKMSIAPWVGRCSLVLVICLLISGDRLNKIWLIRW